MYTLVVTRREFRHSVPSCCQHHKKMQLLWRLRPCGCAAPHARSFSHNGDGERGLELYFTAVQQPDGWEWHLQFSENRPSSWRWAGKCVFENRAAEQTVKEIKLLLHPVTLLHPTVMILERIDHVTEWHEATVLMDRPLWNFDSPQPELWIFSSIHTFLLTEQTPLLSFFPRMFLLKFTVRWH